MARSLLRRPLSFGLLAVCAVVGLGSTAVSSTAHADGKKDDGKKDDGKKEKDDDDGGKKDKDDDDGKKKDDDDKPTKAEALPPEPTKKEDEKKNGPPRARWHPTYSMEIEAHGTVAAFDAFFVGLGGGARLTFPVAANAPIGSIDDEVALGFGVDVVRYGAYKPVSTSSKPGLSVRAVYVPVFLQWNFWLGSRATFFLEPTLIYRYASYIDACSASIYGAGNCAAESRFLPSGSLGLRFRFADHVGMVIRVGWPLANIGVTWL